MGGFGALFSGDMGAGFRAQQGATPEQAQQLYEQQQQRLAQQQAFTQALQAQSPQAIAAQQNLLTQLGQQAQGMGPSVAQNQLAQATGQNVANTAALMASKRGASANAGLVGRQAALAGMGAQQQAAGQAATLRAQEQLANQAQLAGLTGQQLGQIQSAQQLGIGGVQGAQTNVQNALARQNEVNAQIAAGNQKFQAQLTGGVMAGLAGVPMADGGLVQPNVDDGHHYWDHVKKGIQGSFEQDPAFKGGFGAGQALAKGIGGLFGGPSVEGQTQGGYAGANLGTDTSMPTAMNPMATSESIGAYKIPFSHGGEVPAMLSPGEKYLPPREVEEVAKGKKPVDKAGKMIPGRAKVDGDSLKNDTVHARLEEGGIVIPRSVMQSKNPSEQARKFVDAVLARQAMKRK